MMAEVAASLGVKPGAVLLSVGGGGLLCGVIQGLKDLGWMDVPVIAMETVGADCFNAAVKAGKVVTLDDITRLDVVEEVSEFFSTVTHLLKASPVRPSDSPQRGQMSRSEDGLQASLRIQPEQRANGHLRAGDRPAGSPGRPDVPRSVPLFP